MSNVLVFDLGTQSTRALIFNEKGELLCKEKIQFKPYFSVEANYAEQDIEVYLNNICHASKALKEKYPQHFSKISAVTTTTLRDNIMFLDRDTKPLRPVIVWLDQRLCPLEKHPFPASRSFLYRLAGMYDAACTQQQIIKTNWIQKFEKETWEKTDKLVYMSAYINYFFCGKLIDSRAATVGHLPYHYKKNRWMQPSDLNYYVFNCPPEKMIELADAGTVIGTITNKAASLTGIPEGLPYVAGGSDKACEALGTGCMDESMAAVSFGTAATLSVNTDKYVEPQKYMPPFISMLPGKYISEVQVYRGYWMITWFKEQFAENEVKEAAQKGISAEELLNEQLKRVPPGSDGLILQPYWTPSLKIPEGKGTIIGFSDVHTRAHIYRAIVEGIGYALLDGLDGIEKRMGKKIEKLTVSGGGSQSDAICSITADMFGGEVLRAQTYETSGLGAAIGAFVAMKEFDGYSSAIRHMVHYDEPFRPNMENHKHYQILLDQIYKHLYKSVQGLYTAHKRILDKMK